MLLQAVESPHRNILRFIVLSRPSSFVNEWTRGGPSQRVGLFLTLWKVCMDWRDSSGSPVSR